MLQGPDGDITISSFLPFDFFISAFKFLVSLLFTWHSVYYVDAVV